MNRIDKITEIITRVDKGENLELVKNQELDFLRTISPLDIVTAEQNSWENALDTTELRRRCLQHIALLNHPAEKLRHQLHDGHIIKRLLAEHDTIRFLLVDLVDVTASIQNLNYITATDDEYRKLSHIISHLSADQDHLYIEQEILFKELDKKNIQGQLSVLKTEHFDLKFYTEQLEHLIYKCCVTNIKKFQKKLADIVDIFVPLKREHMYKEDNILYPAAIEAIKKPSVWDRLTSQCRDIGYQQY